MLFFWPPLSFRYSSEKKEHFAFFFNAAASNLSFTKCSNANSSQLHPFLANCAPQMLYKTIQVLQRTRFLKHYLVIWHHRSDRLKSECQVALENSTGGVCLLKSRRYRALLSFPAPSGKNQPRQPLQIIVGPARPTRRMKEVGQQEIYLGKAAAGRDMCP